jgi:large subunit ribosomal protein L10
VFLPHDKSRPVRPGFFIFVRNRKPKKGGITSMATSKSKKKQALEQVQAYLVEGANLVVTEYRGINVEQMTALRADLRKAGLKFKVIKNTLMKKLLKEHKVQGLNEHLKGPVGVAFLGRDAAAGSKAVLNANKKNPLFVIKAGLVEGKVINPEGIKAMATLPSREVLLAQLLGTLQAPVRGFMIVARGNTQKLVYALNALKDQKAAA